SAGTVTTTTAPTIRTEGRVVGWSPVGRLDPDLGRVAFTSGGLVAWGGGIPHWSPDGAEWEPVEGPAAGAVVSTAGDTLIAIDPPSEGQPALLWRSDDGGRAWSPVAGSAGALPDIPNVTVTIGEVRSGAVDDLVLVVAELAASLDWPSLLEVDPGRLTTGTVDGRDVVWVEPIETDTSREAYRLDAVRSGSDITLRGIRVSDGEQVFQLRGTAGVLTTEAASTTLVPGGVVGTAVWRSEDDERFERGEQLPIPLAGTALVGGNRLTLISDGSSGEASIWGSDSGESWTIVRDEPPFEDEVLLSAARAADDWIAVTASEAGISFWASIDGRHWFRSDEGRVIGAGAARISVSASGWVAAVTTGDGTSLYWSSNGAAWTIQIVPTRQLASVIATRSGVLAVDTEGAVWFGEIGS
ncbi:MAG TPA: hypothetical protein VLD62_03205, partial [Acidimicrobiia bacterium]|nr:hypothetical protein [Acidimicrobiia bacterium]